MKAKLINGPPCSGKSTYCKKLMTEKDIVYDYDQLSKALNYGFKHKVKREITHPYVIDFRLSILNRMKIDNELDTLYFITTQKPSDSLLKMFDGIDYEIIKMNVTKEECLKRLEKDDNRPDKEAWKKKIEEWFDMNGDDNLSKNIPKDKLNNRQFRIMNPLEVRVNENLNSDFLVRGYAMKYKPYVLYEDQDGEILEEFRKGCFKDSDLSDVIMLYDHQGRVFARTSNNTLKISFDDVGMFIEADLSSNDQARSLYEDIKSGLITKMSWSFKTGDYYFDKKTRTIVHENISKVYDVSAVGIPANNDTEINARNFVDGVIDEIETEGSKEQEKRRKLELKIKLEKEF